MLSNKSGQVAESMTWIVATLIVVVTLTVFIFFSVQLSNVKNLNPSGIVAKMGKFWMSDEVPLIDRFQTKTVFAFSLNEKNKDLINGWIKNENEK